MNMLKLPDLGEGIEEGRIVRWDIKEGDKVKEHQPVGEIETDTAVAKIPSPFCRFPPRSSPGRMSPSEAPRGID